MKNSLASGVKCEKLNSENCREFNVSFEIVPEWNGHLEIFSCPQEIENSSCFSEEIFYRKQSSGAPEYCCCLLAIRYF